MPLRTKVTLDQAAIAGLTGQGGMVDQAVAKAAGRTRDRARQNLTESGRVDTGALRQSIVSERVNAGSKKVTYQVGSPLPYAIFVERGTGVYGPNHSRIWPRRARVLRFKPGKNSAIAAGPDGYVYARNVKGMESRPYLRPAFDDLKAADFT